MGGDVPGSRRAMETMGSESIRRMISLFSTRDLRGLPEAISYVGKEGWGGWVGGWVEWKMLLLLS